MLHTLVRSISTSHHISYVRQLTTTISLITTLFPFMFQFTSQFILSSLRKHLSSIAHCRHFPVNYKRLLSSFWIVLTYVSRDSTIWACFFFWGFSQLDSVQLDFEPESIWTESSSTSKSKKKKKQLEF